jgi:outer membrane protein assembly factor BamA
MPHSPVSSLALKSLTSMIMATAMFLSTPALAQIVALDKSQTIDEKRSGWLPYAFSTDSLDTAIGAGAFTAGTIQPQASLFGTGFVTANDSALVSGAANNFRLGDSRFFTDAFVLLDHFTDQRFYADLDNDPTQAKAGSNDSDEEDFITGVSNELTLNLTLRYSLPIGSVKDDPLAVYTLDEGLLQSGPVGGQTWNPLTSGRTTLASRFFYTYRDLSEFEEDEDQLEAKTNGLEFWLEYDNTDFPRNPSYGSRQQFKVSRDFGWFDSSNSWTNIQFDAAKYYNLGTSSWFKQKALALNFWTSNTPSWETNPANNRPPPNYGSELGGFDRMRAFPTGRFHDKSAVYYSAEMRFTPQFQKMRDWPIINYFDVDWFQIVPFIEAGRVAEDYNADLFTKDLKFDAGIGLRVMAFRSVFRLDFAFSDEGGAVTAMISQPFSRSGN